MTVVLMLPGQGSQFVGMGHHLNEHSPVFRLEMERFFGAYGDGAAQLRHLWLKGTRSDLARAEVAQPLLYAVCLAAARAMISTTPGLKPVLIGHSVGELAAATLAGVLTPELGADLMRRRVELLADAPHGGMVGCRGEPDRVLDIMKRNGIMAVLGADNAPGQCVVSLGEAEIAHCVRALRDEGVACMRVPSTKPFHSPLLAPAGRALGEHLAERQEELRPPALRLISAFSAGPVGHRQALDPFFWSDQMAAPVRFRQALSTLDVPGAIFVEVGPGSTLGMAAEHLQNVAAGSSRVLTPLASPRSNAETWDAAVQEVKSSGSVLRGGR